MKAAVVESFQSPPRYADFAEPTPREGEQLIRVLAAGLHRVVRGRASGSHYSSTGALPLIPGIDGVGELPTGERVFFASMGHPFGSFAEYATAPNAFIMPLPAGLEPATAAALANPGMSSFAALRFRAGFKPGESVLILGATGTSGKLAVQIARRLGARRVVAAGRNADALAETRTLGADETISLAQDRDALTPAFREQLADKGIDIVLDYVWGPPAEALLAAVGETHGKLATPELRYIEIGQTAGATVALDGSILRSANIHLLGSGFGSARLDQIFAAIRELFDLAAREPFALDVRTYPLSEVETVWQQPDTGQRIVFLP